MVIDELYVSHHQDHLTRKTHPHYSDTSNSLLYLVLTLTFNC